LKTIDAKRKIRKVSEKTLLYVVVLMVMIPLIAPVYWMFYTSIVPMKDLTRKPPIWLSPNIKFDSYLYVLHPYYGNLYKPMLDTAIVAISTVGICALLGTFAAYAFAHLEFGWSKVLFLTTIFSQMIPPIAVVIPMYMLMNTLNLIDTHVALIIANSSYTLPFITYVMFGFFAGIPWELEDAALVDGCTKFQALIRVIMPVIAPGLVAGCVVAFMATWSDFLFGLSLAGKDVKMLSIAIYEFRGKFVLNWDHICAGAIVAQIVPFAVAFALQKYLVKGLTAGAIKG